MTEHELGKVRCPFCDAEVTAYGYISGVHRDPGPYVTVHLTRMSGCPHVANPRGPDEGEPIEPESAAALGIGDFFSEAA